MNNDLISREALKDEVRKHAEYYADRTEEDRYNVGYTECACEILDFIDNAPTVAYPFEKFRTMLCGTCQAYMRIEPERPQGEWIIIHTATGKTKCKCNQCQHFIEIGNDKNFCPNCGADMRGQDHEQE